MNQVEIQQAISQVASGPQDDAFLAQQAVKLAAGLLADSKRRQRRSEKRQAAQLARMMDDPSGKAFTLAMADKVFRPPSTDRSAAQFRDLIHGYGVPEYLSLPERVAMQVGASAARVMPDVVMPAITSAMRHQSASVILPAEDDKLKPMLELRRKAGMRMNLNQLGEAILGETEAENRIQTVINRLASPDCDYLSVKISAIFSQINLVGYDETLDRIADCLRRLYRVAIENPANGKPKFLNLDMEEYRDLHLTCDAFRLVLDEPEFFQLEAGIVLQAYLPDSWPVQRDLNTWARERIERGGAGIKIRIVKGANLAMESIDAELHDWPLTCYGSKEEVDANFKRMLHEGCRPENAAAVRIGVASHNLFDIAYALLLRSREKVTDRVEFEMLEGMANHQARSVHAAAGGLLLYAPIVPHGEFHTAIAYLVRRLDENTTEGNFLHDLFHLSEGSPAWEKQKSAFLRACARKDEVVAGPNRTQDRSTEQCLPQPLGTPFHNAADTDWSLIHNVRWVRALVDDMKSREPITIPLVIAGNEETGATSVDGRDPSRPGVVSDHHSLAGPDQVERALQAAVAARADWQALGFARRAEFLRRAAAEIAADRGEAIATMVMDAGKTVSEADAEISEAIDFANYYARPIQTDGARLEPFGTVLVTPPWNFPYAIPCGGILAALVAGNTVILKPAPESVLTAWVMVRALWRAGIPRDVLQFVPCPDDETGRALVTDDRTGAVVLTGSSETARMFLGWKPTLRLFGETSGKNSLIITATADPDQAVKDLVRSAFGHAGQKCSAASLAIVEAEVYDHPSFRNQLRDAAASLVAGPSWNFDSVVTPVMMEPSDALHRALTTLEPGEEWLLKPEMRDNNPCLWTPGIKLGIKPDGWFRNTECFGPVLGIIRADNLEHAIRIQNGSDFGLTGGIHSLDDREITRWMDAVQVGNAYVNRSITGAIVQRQPFGGWKRSCYGPGAKAGGPNQVAQFGIWENDALPEMTAALPAAAKAILDTLVAKLPAAAETLTAAAASDAFWNAHEFSITHDPTALVGEANLFRYRDFRRALIRVSQETSDTDVARLILAAMAIGVPFTLSLETERPWLTGTGVTVRIESTASLLARFDQIATEFELIRSPLGEVALKTAAIAAGLRWADGPVVWNARVEWPVWFREQAVSRTLHRYGNIIPGPADLKIEPRKSLHGSDLAAR